MQAGSGREDALNSHHHSAPWIAALPLRCPCYKANRGLNSPASWLNKLSQLRLEIVPLWLIAPLLRTHLLLLVTELLLDTCGVPDERQSSESHRLREETDAEGCRLCRLGVAQRGAHVTATCCGEQSLSFTSPS